MPLKLTIEVPDDLIEDLDKLAKLHGETREEFAGHSVRFCVTKGAEVEFGPDDMLTEDEAAYCELARQEIDRGEVMTLEEVMRELADRDAAEGAQSPLQAAE